MVNTAKRRVLIDCGLFQGYKQLRLRNQAPPPFDPRDLCGILFADAAHLQEEEARFANKHGFSKHLPALPLFDAAGAQRALKALRGVGFGEVVDPGGGVSFRLAPNGHMPGSGCLVRARRLRRNPDVAAQLSRAAQGHLPCPWRAAAAATLRHRIVEELGWRCRVPVLSGGGNVCLQIPVGVSSAMPIDDLQGRGVGSNRVGAPA